MEKLKMNYLILMVISLVFLISNIAFGKGGEHGYKYNLEELIEQAEENIEKVEQELEQREIERHNIKREDEIREHFEKGDVLYQEGKIEEAKEEWQKVLEIGKDPKMRDYIKKRVKRAIKEQKRLEAEKKKTERERQREFRKQQKAEKKHQEKLERERMSKEKLKLQEVRIPSYSKASEVGQKKREEMVESSQGELKLKLEDLDYKTERECLNALGKNPDDKEVFDNLVELYKLRNKYIARGKELYKKGDYQAAMKEWQKVLAIEPGNKKVIHYIKKAKVKLNSY